MRISFKKIIDSYEKSISKYDHFFKSDHWQRGYKKKNQLFSFKNLKNFRNNSLSFGLDTRVGSTDNQNKLYNELQNKIGLDFVNSHLTKKNVGNLKNLFQEISRVLKNDGNIILCQMNMYPLCNLIEPRHIILKLV